MNILKILYGSKIGLKSYLMSKGRNLCIHIDFNFYFHISLRKVKKDKNIYPKNGLFLFTLSIATVFWFVKIPDYRYAYSILISLITFPFATILSNRSFNKNPNKFFTSIIVIFISIFLVKNLIRIYNTNIYYDYPNPRIYSHNDDNQILDYSYELINNKKIYNQKRWVLYVCKDIMYAL